MSKSTRERWLMSKKLEANETAPSPRGDAVDKIKKFGWNEDPGPEGELLWLDKSQLEIDGEYQRDCEERHVVEIAKAFSWAAFGAIVVARRDDGERTRYFVVIGQHRTRAALKRSDVSRVPAIVFDFGDRRAEADAFMIEARAKRVIQAVDSHKADVFRGDEIAVWIEGLVTRDGYHIGAENSAKTIRCPAAMKRWARREQDALARMWPILARLTKAEQRAVSNMLLDALMYIETNLRDDQSLTRPDWQAKLSELGAKSLEQAAARRAAADGKGGARVWALGMLEALNSGVRKNRRLALAEHN